MKPHKYVIRLGSKEKQALRELARAVARPRPAWWNAPGFCCGRMTV